MSLRSVFFAFFIFLSTLLWAWGPTGHRVVGYVAQKHLTSKTAKKVDAILSSYSLEMCGNYLDFIRSDTQYRHMNAWHYVSIPDGKTYAECDHKSAGDVIQIIEKLVQELKTKEFSVVENEEFAIMALVHLVGDLHQPLHVGLEEDRGGNSVSVNWFGKKTNLHRIWDKELIDHLQLSYTELGNHINRNITKSQIALWQNSTVREWAQESQNLRTACYDFEKDTNLGYSYSFRHTQTMQIRLEQAGVRLAGLLNEIYN